MRNRFVQLLACFALLVSPTLARIPASFVIDTTSGRVYHAQNADRQVHPASLTKMMTLYMVFDALDKGVLSLDTRVRFSRNAARKPRSRLGVRAGQSLSVREVIKAMVVRSANDVATAIGEHLGGGSETRFARMMTQKARELGMRRTQFKNASGLPNRYQHTTARDMATLGAALRRDFPRHFEFFKTRFFKYKGHTYRSTNKLLGNVKGVDGIKTGYINASGFNLTTSFVHNDHRFVAVVIGGSTGRSRDMKMRNLIQRTTRSLDRESRSVFTFFRGNNKAMPRPKLSPIMHLAKRTKPSHEGSGNRKLARRNAVSLPILKTKAQKASHWNVRMGSGANRSRALQLASTVRSTLRKALGFTPKFHVAGKKRGRAHAQLFALTESQARSACRALQRRNVPCVARSG